MADRIMRNVKLVAVNGKDREWFHIYIDFSGQREYLMSHRRNTRLYSLLKDGVSVRELERNAQRIVVNASQGRRCVKGDINPRLKYKRNQTRKFENSISHLIDVANVYVMDAACAA